MKPYSCAGKERFEKYAFAEGLAKRSRRNNNTNRHAYRCTHCNGFHIGSQQGRKRRPHQEDEEMAA